MNREYALQNKILQRPSVGLSGFYFSRRIAAQYALGQRSGRLPRLIFPRLKSLTWINKIININYTGTGTCSFGLYVNLYFKVPDVASETLRSFIITREKTLHSLFFPLRTAALRGTALRGMGSGKSFIDRRHVLHSQVMLSHYLLHLLRNKRSKIYSGELKENTHPKLSPIPNRSKTMPQPEGERLNLALAPSIPLKLNGTPVPLKHIGTPVPLKLVPLKLIGTPDPLKLVPLKLIGTPAPLKHISTPVGYIHSHSSSCQGLSTNRHGFSIPLPDEGGGRTCKGRFLRRLPFQTSLPWGEGTEGGDIHKRDVCVTNHPHLTSPLKGEEYGRLQIQCVNKKPTLVREVRVGATEKNFSYFTLFKRLEAASTLPFSKVLDLWMPALRAGEAGRDASGQRQTLHSQIMLPYYLNYLSHYLNYLNYLSRKRREMHSGESAKSSHIHSHIKTFHIKTSHIHTDSSRTKPCQEAGELNQPLIFNSHQALFSFRDSPRPWPPERNGISHKGMGIKKGTYKKGMSSRISHFKCEMTFLFCVPIPRVVFSSGGSQNAFFLQEDLGEFLKQKGMPSRIKIIPFPPLENRGIRKTALVAPCPSRERSGSAPLTAPAPYALSPRLEGVVIKLEGNGIKLRDRQSNSPLPPLEKGELLSPNRCPLTVNRYPLRFQRSTVNGQRFSTVQTCHNTPVISPLGQKAPFFDNIFVPYCPILNHCTPHLLTFLSPTRERRGRYQVTSEESIKESMVVLGFRPTKNSMIKSSTEFQKPALVRGYRGSQEESQGTKGQRHKGAKGKNFVPILGRSRCLCAYVPSWNRGGSQEDREGAGIHGARKEKYAVLPARYEQNQIAPIIMRKALPLLIAGGQSLPDIAGGRLPDNRTGNGSPWPYGQGEIASIDHVVQERTRPLVITQNVLKLKTVEKAKGKRKKVKSNTFYFLLSPFSFSDAPQKPLFHIQAAGSRFHYEPQTIPQEVRSQNLGVRRKSQRPLYEKQALSYETQNFSYEAQTNPYEAQTNPYEAQINSYEAQTKEEKSTGYEVRGAEHNAQRTTHYAQSFSYEAQTNPYEAQILPHWISYAKDKPHLGVRTGVGVQKTSQMAIIPPWSTGILKKLRDSLISETSVSMGKIPSLVLEVSAKTGYPEPGSNRQQGLSSNPQGLRNNPQQGLGSNPQETNQARQEMTWQKGKDLLISHMMIPRPANLIFKKPVVTQHDDLASENKGNVQAEKSISTKFKRLEAASTVTDSRIEDSKKRSIHEVNLIADQVYKVIEKRIAIEKERRGRL